MHSYAVRARLVVGCVLLGALAGCGGDPPTPPPFTPTTSSTSPTPTSTEPVEPVLPDAATEPTEAGARAFAEFYWELVNYAQATGDTSPVRLVSAQTCQPCASSASAIDRVYAKGGVIRGGDYSVTSVDTQALDVAHPAYRLLLQVKNTKQQIDYPGVDKDSSLTSGSAAVRMYVDFLHGQWLAAVVEPVS